MEALEHEWASQEEVDEEFQARMNAEWERWYQEIWWLTDEHREDGLNAR